MFKEMFGFSKPQPPEPEEEKGNDTERTSRDIVLSDLRYVLLSKIANINEQNEKGQTALMIALMLGDIGVAYAILELDCNVKLTDNLGYSALMYALRLGNSGLVHKIIDKGADINARALDGTTPLHILSEYNLSTYGFTACTMELLVNLGADVNVKDAAGNNVLMKALHKKVPHSYYDLMVTHKDKFKFEI